MTGKIMETIRRMGIRRVLTDSRSLQNPDETIFFALHTPTNDGHNYIAELAAKGVRAFVVERCPQGIDATFIEVPDTLAALQQLASAHRQELPARFIAVAGSRGKTIVKEWIAEALAAKASSARSPRSFNSRIGVPLSLLGVTPDHAFAVIEAGVSQAGEMSVLQRMIAPELVVITGINDTEHSAGFVDFNQKCAEKLLLASGAKAIVYPAELDDMVARHVPPQVLKIGVAIPPQADWMERDRLIAAEALRWLGAELPAETVRPLCTRLDVSDGVNNCLVITDTFTCDLFSLDSAVDFMMRRHTPGQRRLTVVLDRLRGADSRQMNELTRRLHSRGIDRVILYRPGMEISVGDFNNDLILVKGEPGSYVAALGERLKARHHETVLEVNLDAVVHNFNHFRALLKPETGIVAMVKASGYGAGAYELAKTLQSQGAAYLAVAVVDEGEELRRAGITMPIMALNPKVTNYDSLFSNALEPEVFSFGMLDEIIAEATKRGISGYPVHIKFDTGMHRLGFLHDEIDGLCNRLRATSAVRVASVFSHLATADCLDMDDYTLGQLDLFTDICTKMRARLNYQFKRHILNSAGIARFPKWQFEMVRLGISLYGVDTIGVAETAGLRTISTLRSPVISIKHWPAGTSIGYGRRTILKRDSVIATVAVGYADGLDRHLGNGAGKVWVNGTLCPIAGNVCMDACMIDVTDAPAVDVGTSVEFFGENLPVDEVAKALDTIPYEILTSVSPRVKRVYYRE